MGCSNITITLVFSISFYLSWQAFHLQLKRERERKEKKKDYHIFSLDKFVAVVSQYTSLVSCKVLTVSPSGDVVKWNYVERINTVWCQSYLARACCHPCSSCAGSLAHRGHPARMWMPHIDRTSIVPVSLPARAILGLAQICLLTSCIHLVAG